MSTKSESISNSAQPATEIPTFSRAEERAAAAQRAAGFPYRFPRDRRQLGGKFAVAENARRLQRWLYFERRLLQALGAWTLSIPEFEVKLATGPHIFYHAHAAGLVRRRLREQELRLAGIDQHAAPAIQPLRAQVQTSAAG